MSANVLTEAADLMEQRANAAGQGGYGFSSKWTTATTMLTRITQGGRTIAENRGNGESLHDMHHLSYWSPPVALAVAAWLRDVHADVVGAFNPDMFMDNSSNYQRAEAVALAYLGRDA